MTCACAAVAQGITSANIARVAKLCAAAEAGQLSDEHVDVIYTYLHPLPSKDPSEATFWIGDPVLTMTIRLPSDETEIDARFIVTHCLKSLSRTLLFFTAGMGVH